MNDANWEMRARALIRRAALAPSSHNTQPWLFRIEPGAIDLLADRTRALPVNDPQDRELTISCGCALMNLRLAAASEGLVASVRLFPEPTDADWLSRMGVEPGSGRAGEDAGLAAGIEPRRTYRKRFADHEVKAAAIEQLVGAARTEGAWLRPLHAEDERRQLAELVSAGDEILWSDPRWRRELAAWMHPRRRGDGLSVPALVAPVAQYVVRTFDMGGGVAARDQQLAQGSPVLAVLGTDSDEPADWMAAGQALQRVLLEACRQGLQASYLNQPVQVESLRPELGRLVGGSAPQIVLRLGHPAEEVGAAPRRVVDELIETAG